MPTTVNPATNTPIAEHPWSSTAQVDAALEAAVAAQRTWRGVPVSERCDLLKAIAAELRHRRDALATLITAEMGKPTRQARAEVDKCAACLEYYADNGPAFLAEDVVETQARHSGVRYEPLGVVLAIMPWNYPLWQFFRFCAPALVAGNGAVLKHAANVAGCAEAIMSVLDAAGVPDGLVANLLVPNDQVETLVRDRRIAAVTLTGSTRVGALVASQAAGELKRQVLELGGCDPFIVAADADLERASDVAVNARFTASGQSCVNSKRFLVVDEVADQFVRLFAEKASRLVVGDPTDERTDVGPLAREDLRSNLEDQVRRSIADGAELVIGGDVVPGDGWFYQPTILDRVPLTAAAAREETFGPVAAVIRVTDLDEAILVANDTDYGLGASVWTSDPATAERLAAELEAGAVFVNAQVASDPRLPFGGIKRSGYGRELAANGLREFVNVKTVWFD